MSFPLDLVEQIRCGNRQAIDIRHMPVDQYKDDIIFIRDYRRFEYYKRINGKYFFARNLLKREIDDFRFQDGHSFRSCTIVERMK